MNKKLEAVLAGFFVFALFYLVASFIEIDFNIKNWELGTRIIVGVIGAIFAAIASAAYATLPADE
jgi:hypothetical protein